MSTGGVPCADWEPRWCETLSTAAAAVTGTMVTAATQILWAATGRQFGLCQVTLRPCRRECTGMTWLPEYGGSWGPWPALIRGVWYNVTCGVCTEGCACSPLEEARLPAPVHSVVEVKLDGSVLVTGSYRVDDHRFLVRTDGGVWPTCQDLSKDDTEDNTWSVTARFGSEVPELGEIAVGELTAQLAKACVGESCRLPRNVQSLARQGVSIEFTPLEDVIKNNRLGLYFSDLFIQTFNPDGLRARSRVYNVDGPGFRIVDT